MGPSSFLDIFQALTVLHFILLHVFTVSSLPLLFPEFFSHVVIHPQTNQFRHHLHVLFILSQPNCFWKFKINAVLHLESPSPGKTK
ncbi:hypothetical protein L2E82_24600 [Cichorium intybus]|uniref:Uncharacterized protein n=1 Tax=Cichorium intybus TaxID=13427 RepID=A0ACB9E1C8_CICIN|nr:hypothetical protein L2E82_24600 [Cichorium intybus]